ncbi:hypothetical protein GQ457_02G010710 [Hibiscus cannabinus]
MLLEGLMLPVVFMLLVDQMMAVVLILQVEPMKVDKVFHEELNDVDGDNNESDWVDGDNLLSDDDDEEMVAIKNKFKLVEDLGPDVVLEESVHVSIEENEDLKGLGGGEETDYLDSSDAGSYETNSDGGIICKKSVVEMQKLGREELKVELQKHTCIKARKWALEKIRGSVVLEFNRLFDYVFALRKKLEAYVFDAYKKHVYVDLYTDTLPTILSEKFWKDTKMGSLDPPLKRKLSGRPKQKRKREEAFDEKLWGVYSGVRCALDSGFHKVVFESDCLDMIRLLSLGSAHNNRMPILSDIRDLLWYLDDFQFTHVRREGTKVTDRLCDFVSSLDFEIHVLEALMDALARLLLADVG